MNGTAKKASARQLRRALGPSAVDLINQHSEALTIVSGFLQRGFFGRLMWLLFGR